MTGETPSATDPTTLHFRLHRPLPLGLALPFGEHVRQLVQRMSLTVLGRLPPELDDHPPEGLAQQHHHPFYLLDDPDNDGRAELLVVYTPRGVNHDQQHFLAWLASRPELDSELTWCGTASDAPGRLTSPGPVWCSLTPFVANVHLKRHRGPAWALLREMAERGMPAPVRIERLKLDPAAFQTTRRSGTVRAGRSGHPGAFFRLMFAEPVAGPLAFGFACHLGLGVFVREETRV